MAHREITRSMLQHVIKTGIIIKDYPDDKPYPSRLVLGYVGLRPIHIVLTELEDMYIVISAYEPDIGTWEADMKRRKL